MKISQIDKLIKSATPATFRTIHGETFTATATWRERGNVHMSNGARLSIDEIEIVADYPQPAAVTVDRNHRPIATAADRIALLNARIAEIRQELAALENIATGADLRADAVDNAGIAYAAELAEELEELSNEIADSYDAWNDAENRKHFDALGDVE